MNIKTLNGMDTKTPNREITNGKITNGKIMIGLEIKPATGNSLRGSRLRTNKITSGNGDSADSFKVSSTDIGKCRARQGR